MQGQVPSAAAADVAARLYELGCYEVSMGDTNGVGTPATVAAMFQVMIYSVHLCMLDLKRQEAPLPDVSARFSA